MVEHAQVLHLAELHRALGAHQLVERGLDLRELRRQLASSPAGAGLPSTNH
jgi:hypothetical protein